MNRQNKRNYCPPDLEELGAWDFQPYADDQESIRFPNIFSLLSNNLNSYTNSNRNERRAFTTKLNKQQKQATKNRKQFRFSHSNIKLQTNNIGNSCKKDKINISQLQKARKRLITQQEQCQLFNFQNVPANLKVKLGKTVQPSAVHVKNVQFDKMAPGCIKKKDKYKEIFGDKPKVLFKKVDQREGSTNRRNISISLVRLR